MFRRILNLLLATLVLGAAATCEASRPVQVATEGCVVGGRLYAIHDQETVYPYTLSTPMDLRRYEGKRVWLEGSLLPGDRFTPRTRRFRVIGRVNRKVRGLVARHESIWDIAPDAVQLPGESRLP